MDNKLWFYNETYRENINFCTDITDEDFYEIFHNLTGYRYGEDLFCDGKTIEYGEGILIYLKNSSDIHILAHECFHASNIIMRKRGIKPDPYNDEPQAYLIQWLFNNCFNHIKKLNEVIKEDSDHFKDAMSCSIQKELDDITIESLCGQKEIINNINGETTKEINSLIDQFLKQNPKLRADQVEIIRQKMGDRESIRVESSMSEDKYSKIQSFLEIAHDEIIKIEKNLKEIGCKDGAIMDDLKKVKTLILKVYHDN